MIVTELYEGQGLGNQLWCYLVTRIIAHKSSLNFGIQSSEKFKGKDFLKIDFGLSVSGGSGPEGGPPICLPDGINNYYREKLTVNSKSIDISKFDEDLLQVGDNTKVDGVMQSVNYIKGYKSLIKQWLVFTKYLDDDVNLSKDICVIHIRGGDYRFSSAFLNRAYYNNAIEKMLKSNKEMKFVIVTDDVNYSKSIFPDIDIIGGSSQNLLDTHKAQHHLGGPIWQDWLILFNTRNVILSASSFSFLPVFLNDNVNVIAPMYWADYNTSDGYWSRNDMIVDGWNYLDRFNRLKNSETCKNELDNYHLQSK